MKLCILIALALFSYTAANIQNDFENGITAQGGPHEVHLTVGSDVFTHDDTDLTETLKGLEMVQGRNIVANAIQNALENAREVVINGNGDIPPLDPLVLETVGPFEYSMTGVLVSASLHNLNLEGLRWYVVDHVTFNTLRLALGVKVTVPWLTFTGAYDASARIVFISYSAGGNFRVFINRFETTVDVRLGTNILGGGTLILRELDILLNISDVTIRIEGMVGSSLLNNMINIFIQNAAQNLLRDELEAFSQLLSQELFDTINEFLANFTLDDLLGL